MKLLTNQDIETLRTKFEAKANDSFGFKRSPKGTYRNPSVARDWRWFLAGAEAAPEDPPNKKLIELGRQLANIAFNLGQAAGRAITDAEAKSMREMCKAWDEEARKLPKKPT